MKLCQRIAKDLATTLTELQRGQHETLRAYAALKQGLPNVAKTRILEALQHFTGTPLTEHATTLPHKIKMLLALTDKTLRPGGVTMNHWKQFNMALFVYGCYLVDTEENYEMACVLFKQLLERARAYYATQLGCRLAHLSEEGLHKYLLSKIRTHNHVLELALADFGELYHYLGHCEERCHRLDAALTYYHTALDFEKEAYSCYFHPLLGKTHLALGRVYNRQQAYKRALLYLEQSLKAFQAFFIQEACPDIIQAYIQYAIMFYQKRRYFEAERYAKHAFHLNAQLADTLWIGRPWMIELHTLLGDLALLKGDYRRAKTAFQQAMQQPVQTDKVQGYFLGKVNYACIQSIDCQFALKETPDPKQVGWIESQFAKLNSKSGGYSNYDVPLAKARLLRHSHPKEAHTILQKCLASCDKHQAFIIAQIHQSLGYLYAHATQQLNMRSTDIALKMYQTANNYLPLAYEQLSQPSEYALAGISGIHFTAYECLKLKARTLLSLGKYYWKQDQPQKAWPLLQEARGLLKALYPAEHPERLRSYGIIAMVQTALYPAEYPKAITRLKKVKSAYEALLGTRHPYLKHLEKTTSKLKALLDRQTVRLSTPLNLQTGQPYQPPALTEIYIPRLQATAALQHALTHHGYCFVLGDYGVGKKQLILHYLKTHYTTDIRPLWLDKETQPRLTWSDFMASLKRSTSPENSAVAMVALGALDWTTYDSDVSSLVKLPLQVIFIGTELPMPLRNSHHLNAVVHLPSFTSTEASRFILASGPAIDLALLDTFAERLKKIPSLWHYVCQLLANGHVSLEPLYYRYQSIFVDYEKFQQLLAENYRPMFIAFLALGRLTHIPAPWSELFAGQTSIQSVVQVAHWLFFMGPYLSDTQLPQPLPLKWLQASCRYPQRVCEAHQLLEQMGVVERKGQGDPYAFTFKSQIKIFIENFLTKHQLAAYWSCQTLVFLDQHFNFHRYHSETWENSHSLRERCYNTLKKALSLGVYDIAVLTLAVKLVDYYLHFARDVATAKTIVALIQEYMPQIIPSNIILPLQLELTVYHAMIDYLRGNIPQESIRQRLLRVLKQSKSLKSSNKVVLIRSYAYRILGYLYERANNPKEAIQTYHRALKILDNRSQGELGAHTDTHYLSAHAIEFERLIILRSLMTQSALSSDVYDFYPKLQKIMKNMTCEMLLKRKEALCAQSRLPSFELIISYLEYWHTELTTIASEDGFDSRRANYWKETLKLLRTHYATTKTVPESATIQYSLRPGNIFYQQIVAFYNKIRAHESKTRNPHLRIVRSAYLPIRPKLCYEKLVWSRSNSQLLKRPEKDWSKISLIQAMDDSLLHHSSNYSRSTAYSPVLQEAFARQHELPNRRQTYYEYSFDKVKSLLKLYASQIKNHSIEVNSAVISMEQEDQIQLEHVLLVFNARVQNATSQTLQIPNRLLLLLAIENSSDALLSIDYSNPQQSEPTLTYYNPKDKAVPQPLLTVIENNQVLSNFSNNSIKSCTAKENIPQELHRLWLVEAGYNVIKGNDVNQSPTLLANRVLNITPEV